MRFYNVGFALWFQQSVPTMAATRMRSTKTDADAVFRWLDGKGIRASSLGYAIYVYANSFGRFQCLRGRKKRVTWQLVD